MLSINELSCRSNFPVNAVTLCTRIELWILIITLLFTEKLSFIFSEMYYNNEHFYSSLFMSHLCLMCLAYFKFENHYHADGVCFCILCAGSLNNRECLILFNFHPVLDLILCCLRACWQLNSIFLVYPGRWL